MAAVQRWPILLLLVATAACGGGSVRPDVPTVPPPPASLPVSTLSRNVGPQLQVREDPAAVVVARADAEFVLGERELAAGRMVTAREHFDKAIDHLLGLPAGARSSTATSAAFD